MNLIIVGFMGRKKRRQVSFFFFFKRLFLSLRQEGREKERERNTNVQLPLACPPSLGTLACNPGMCPDGTRTGDPLGCSPALNPLSHTSQGRRHVS